MTENQYKRKHTSVSLINYHFVFCPKRRKKVLVNDVGRRLEEIIYQKAKELECDVLTLEIMPDHVHLFISCPPTLAPHQIMFRIKGASSRLLRKEFPHLLRLPSLWTRSYYCGTAGHVSSETIKKYIANQHTL
ncbi:transposase IS200-family protein [Rippkaea orientalis PCC 8801]|uniref:Transposase IS200-family protein n=1 Tax=Rippkaea orientalis (strain PCC 8801 / RF-1) TaxID=41431 RepID=B7JUN9_RIPO1|nr:IS200/IS605 family transposase [Rippkaea orientalis]ACK65583.1 transposase IS200-family protein [Rippkaea orientalis PCC 8801]ACK67849.1 transposase IS200-family protein [Rippkaea orientalis PCC 8801]